MQERLSPRRPTRTWFVAVWTATIVALLMVAEVAIGGSEDDLGLNGTLEAGVLILGILIWGLGFWVIWFVAYWLIPRRRRPVLFLTSAKRDA